MNCNCGTSSSSGSKLTTNGLVVFTRFCDWRLAVTYLVTCRTSQSLGSVSSSSRSIICALSMSLFSRTLRETDQDVVLLTTGAASWSLVSYRHFRMTNFERVSICNYVLMFGLHNSPLISTYMKPSLRLESLEPYSASCCMASSHEHSPRC